MVNLVPLSQWLSRQPEQTVAVDRSVPITALAFRQRVHDWIEALKVVPGERWAVFHHDAFEFLSIVYALWCLSRVACIPGDNRPGSSLRLKSTVDGFAGEFDLDNVVSAGNAPIQSEFLWPVLDPSFVGLEIYTSGSTGEPTAIGKTIAQLELEVEALESLWPDQSGTVVLSTVSHQHMYGLTFRLFWPLSSGRAFERKAIEYTEDILHLARHYPAFSLVSSPSHLSRINTSVNWTELNSSCRYVLSSAAPLSRTDSLNVGKLLGTGVREIYGSSETGAIAWRSQQESDLDAPWHPLPGVSLSGGSGGSLEVCAPHLDNPNGYTLADRVEFIGRESFNLIGRADRIVKIEGKRVSLAAIEKHLLEHIWVKDVRALVIERRRVESAAVVELSSQGRTATENLGVREITKNFRALLSKHFEAVVVPRRWRIVAQMPYNQQGKLTQADLHQLFSKAVVKWPEITREESAQSRLIISCRIPSELVYFDGHFPDNPILPGIVQVHWAEAYGREFLAIKGVFDRLEVIKFQQVIPPGLEVTLTLEFDANKSKLTFCYASDKGTHSSGRICFRP